MVEQIAPQFLVGHGIAYLALFERLEREREGLAKLDDQLARAQARSWHAKGNKIAA